MSHFVHTVMDDETLSFLITLTALLVFIISGWGSYWIWRARRSGWTRLASVYGTTPRKDAVPRRWLSVKLMPAKVNYPYAITLRLTVDGLYISPASLLRLGHDPLLVPWDDIEIFALETYPADRLYELKFALEPRVRLQVGVAVAQFIRRAADNVHYFVERPIQSTSPANIGRQRTTIA